MIYEIIQYGLLTTVCVYLVNYYSGKDVSLQVKIWSVVTWVLNFGLALLVPQDVYQTLMGQTNREINMYLGMQYLVLYWSVYLLTWTIIPVLQEWQDAGDFESKDRLKRSLRSNGIFYLAMIVGAVIFLIILILLNAGGQMGLITFLKCLATIWGMILLMVLMGYALVQVPKTMWRNANPKDYLDYLYKRVIETEEEVDQSINQFKKVASYVSYVKRTSTDELIGRYCQASEDMIPQQLKKSVNAHYQTVLRTTGYFLAYPVSLQNAIQHKRLMKRSIARWRRQQKAKADYVRQALFYQDIIEAIQKQTPLRSLAKKTNPISEMWYCRIRHRFNKIFSVVIGMGSLLVLISETQVFLTRDSSLLAYLLRIDNIQVIRICVFIVIAFIIYMSNYSLFRLKLANLYGLYYKQSDGASLMFATVNFSRIGVAIVLNFFDMIKMQNSIYATVMQAPSMGLLGQWVIKGLPGLLWLIVLCHYFNVWGWLAKKIGFDDKLSFASHQLTADGKSKAAPARIKQMRKELQQNHSKAILQFQQMEKL